VFVFVFVCDYVEVAGIGIGFSIIYASVSVDVSGSEPGLGQSSQMRALSEAGSPAPEQAKVLLLM
jgi:hypothetical protein